MSAIASMQSAWIIIGLRIEIEGQPGGQRKSRPGCRFPTGQSPLSPFGGPAIVRAVGSFSQSLLCRIVIEGNSVAVLSSHTQELTVYLTG